MYFIKYLAITIYFSVLSNKLLPYHTVTVLTWMQMWHHYHITGLAWCVQHHVNSRSTILLFYHWFRHSLDIQMEPYINYSVWIHLSILSWQHIEQLEGYLQIIVWIWMALFFDYYITLVSDWSIVWSQYTPPDRCHP